MSDVELYVRTEAEAESYRNRFRSAKDGLENEVVVRVATDNSLRLPAVRTAYNVYEGEVSVRKALSHLIASKTT
jgi:hypothetical protein